MHKFSFNFVINNENEAKKSEELKENPYMIFNNTFTDLHTLFGGNKAKNSGIKSAEMNDEKGTSLVIIHSNKGKELFGKIENEIKRKQVNIPNE